MKEKSSSSSYSYQNQSSEDYSSTSDTPWHGEKPGDSAAIWRDFNKQGASTNINQYDYPVTSGTNSNYGDLNAAGFPKNQYVEGYFKDNGTYVEGYYRNSPTDNLPTCEIIDC